MRLPDWPGEHGRVDQRDPVGQGDGAGDELRQRLDRLAAGHPSAPEYERPAGSGEQEYGGTLPDAQPPESWVPSADGRARPDSRPDSGTAGGLAGRREPYRPWFTAGESPEPWFTGDPWE
jgi:hypothetical protein